MIRIFTISEIKRFPFGMVKEGYRIRYLPKGQWRYKTAAWAFEHRLIAEAVLGRRLKRSETVHHKDHVKTNNNPRNLKVMSRKKHGQTHSPLRGRTVKCSVCGKPFYMSRFDEGRGRAACSRKCAVQLPGAIANRKNLRPPKTNVRLNTRIVSLKNSGLTWEEVSKEAGVTVPGCRDRYARTYKGPRIMAVPRSRKRVEIPCGFCRKILFVRPSKIRMSKSGKVFCDCSCFGRFNAGDGVQGRSFTKGEDKKIRSMFSRGANYSEIAKELGRHRGTIRERILRKFV